MDYRYTVSGLLIGFLIGTTGMGGGSLMTPLLILVLGVKPTVAIGSDLAYAAITKIVGGYRHMKHGTVNTGLALRMAAGSVPGSVIGVAVIDRLKHRLGDGTQQLVIHILGFMLLVIGSAMLLKGQPWVKRWARRFKKPARGEGYLWPVGAGLVLGCLVGVTSVGSGTLFGVLLILIFGLKAKAMVGTDVFHAAMLSTAAAASHVVAGNVDYALVGNLLLGSIPGVLMGSHAAAKMPNKKLQPILAVVLLISGINML